MRYIKRAVVWTLVAVALYLVYDSHRTADYDD